MVVNLASINHGISVIDAAIEAVNNIISDRRLMVGGAAMFAADTRNHIKVIMGKVLIIPLFRAILRVEDVSYVMFARQNIAEEDSPWAIIIVRAALHPQEVFLIIPRISNPIWPTDE